MPFKVNKRGEETGIWLGDGISNRILSLLPLGQSFKSSLGHEHPPAPCHTGSLDPRGLGRQVSPALHMTLIHTTVHRWSQERPVGNKPALERRACWEPRPAQATATSPMVREKHPAVPGKSRPSEQTPAPSASILSLKSYMWWGHGEQNQQKNPQTKPAPSLHYSLFFHRCLNLTYLSLA